jgi:hypothetical protein
MWGDPVSTPEWLPGDPVSTLDFPTGDPVSPEISDTIELHVPIPILSDTEMQTNDFRDPVSTPEIPTGDPVFTPELSRKRDFEISAYGHLEAIFDPIPRNPKPCACSAIAYGGGTLWGSTKHTCAFDAALWWSLTQTSF